MQTRVGRQRVALRETAGCSETGWRLHTEQVPWAAGGQEGAIRRWRACIHGSGRDCTRRDAPLHELHTVPLISYRQLCSLRVRQQGAAFPMLSGSSGSMEGTHWKAAGQEGPVAAVQSSGWCSRPSCLRMYPSARRTSATVMPRTGSCTTCASQEGHRHVQVMTGGMRLTQEHGWHWRLACMYLKNRSMPA